MSDGSLMSEKVPISTLLPHKTTQIMFSVQFNLQLPTKVCTKEDFYKVVDSERVKKKIEAFRRLKAEGSEKADAEKRGLPLFIYQATFDETESKKGSKARWRQQHAARLNGLVMLDIDHIDNPAKVFMRMPHEWFEEGAKNQVMLVHITPSGKGLRVVFKADAEIGDLSANQHHLATLMGVEPDEACKDASRGSFAPQRDEILYLNDAVFEYDNKEYDERYGEQYRTGCKMADVGCKTTDVESQTADIEPVTSYKGIPVTDIIEEYWRRTGGVPVDGERNVRLHKLAVNLRAIMENEPRRILAVIPRLGLPEDEVRRTVESACKEKPRDFTYMLKGIVKDLQGERNIEDDEQEAPPEMPKKLPKLIALLLSRTPDVYKPAVAHAVFPALAAHFYKVRFRYIDNVLHEATLMNVLMAGTGAGKGGQQFQIMCLAFDPGNRYGQTRVGTSSVTEKVCIRFNWNAATTISKGQRYFRSVLTDGPVSRINFCTIPEREIGAEMPVYGTYDAAFEEELRPYIERLTKAVGEVDCPQGFRLAQKMVEENAEFARLSQSRVYENLSFRANVIAWLKGCLLYVANDYKWTREIEEFVRWSLQYDMWCKMQFFGEAIENADAVEDKPKRGPRNLLELLPDEFTLQDAINVRRQQGMDAKGAKNMLYQWSYRGYVKSLTPYTYRKQ